VSRRASYGEPGWTPGSLPPGDHSTIGSQAAAACPSLVHRAVGQGCTFEAPGLGELLAAAAGLGLRWLTRRPRRTARG
jgi:hypothetical protein